MVALGAIARACLHPSQPAPVVTRPLPDELRLLLRVWAGELDEATAPTIEQLEAGERALLRGGFDKHQWPEVVATAANVAASLHAVFGADRAVTMLHEFEASAAAGRSMSEYYCFIKGRILSEAGRETEALAAAEAGLGVLKLRGGKAIDPADPHCEEVLLRSLLAMVHQKLGNVLAAAREVDRIGRLQVKSPDARRSRLFATADQLLLSDDHELTLQVIEESTEFTDDPHANLYRAAAEAGMSKYQAAGIARLQACRQDPNLQSWQRALAAAKLVQVRLGSDADAATLSSELQLAHRAVDVAAAEQGGGADNARRKLVIAHADAWLRHGDAITADPGQLLRQLTAGLAVVTEAPGARRMTAGHAQLWDDDRTWLLTTLLRLEWRLASDPEAAWRRVLQHLLQVQGALELGTAPVLDPEQARAYFVTQHRGLLILVPGRTCSVLFLLDARGAMLIDSLPNAKHLRALRDELLAKLRGCTGQTDVPAPEQDAALALMRSAGASLFPATTVMRTTTGEERAEPVARRIAAWREMTIGSLGQLDGMPFDALIVPDGPDLALGERVAIAHAVSLAHDPRREPGAPLPGPQSAALLATLFSDPSVGGQPNYIVSDSQLEPVRQSLPEGTRVWLNDKATIAAWTTACQPTPRLVELLAHGCRVTSQHTEFNTVRLTPTRAGESTALVGSLLPERGPSFMVLSACDHADTPRVRGDLALTNSLAGEMLLRGVGAVVAPLGKLMLGPNLEFLRVLNLELQRGQTLAESLRVARVTDNGNFAERIRRLLMPAYGCAHAAVFATR